MNLNPLNEGDHFISGLLSRVHVLCVCVCVIPMGVCVNCSGTASISLSVLNSLWHLSASSLGPQAKVAGLRCYPSKRGRKYSSSLLAVK